MARLLTRDLSWALNSSGEISDYVRVPGWNPEGNGGETITVAGWGRSANNIFTHNLIGKFDYGNNNRSWHIAITDGRLRVTLSTNGSSLTKRYETNDPTNDNGRYHLFGFDWDGLGTGLRIKKDENPDKGVIKAIDGAMTTIHQSTTDIMLGSILQSNAPRADWAGQIAALWIWNRTLTDEEWLGLYYSGIVPQGGLEAEWLLQEGTGVTANDTSGNGHHGTINGMDWAENRGPFRLRETATNRSAATNRVAATNRSLIS